MSKYYNYSNLAEKPTDKKRKSPTRNYINYSKSKAAGTKIHLNNKLRLRCFFLVVIVSAMGMFITFRNGVAASQGYELVKMKQSVSSLEKENSRLKLDIAGLKSPERIKGIAVKDLGMVLPPQIYFANKNR
ncbi:cell division protein FtsL [Pectinatus haikarae]|uniref:Cell division protein FtsL n=1 Tax=Pectinatus haikarae TaxID=349096 RepID=A0ABT9Y7L5_9FIRM|nr:cell division protein FtsL [Pectinatus haikarae]MDQ0203475.1 cell division protein FtsL [Pectinatus haikarae]